MISSRTIAFGCLLCYALLPGCAPEAGQAIAEATPVVATAAPVETGPLAIQWEQLDVDIPPDSEFQPWMITSRVQALEGRRVRIAGYMFGGLLQTSGVREFPLLREKDCPFGQGGQPHHAISVELADKLRTSYTPELVTVEGKFSVRPWTGPNGKTWSLYHLEVTKIE